MSASRIVCPPVASWVAPPDESDLASVRYDEREDTWLVTNNFLSRPTSLNGCRGIPIPKGFKTDLASVPRVFWSIIPPYKLTIEGAVTHDWLYRHGGCVNVVTAIGDTLALENRTYARPQADQFFLDWMITEGVPEWKRDVAYRGVRIFGVFSWKHLAGSAQAAALNG